jgi:hypothetical protein
MPRLVDMSLGGDASPAFPTDVQKPARADDDGGRMRRRRNLTRLMAALALSAAGGCASGAGAAGARSGRELVMAYDDSRPDGTVAFPSRTYESVVRFDLPAGPHRPLRLRLQVAAPGALAITVYDDTPLETPGDAVFTVRRDLEGADLSDGKDGRWIVEDLSAMKPVRGAVWVGVHKEGGEPTIWSSAVVSGRAFVRNNDPQNPMGLLPVRRTPMIRLELSP